MTAESQMKSLAGMRLCGKHDIPQTLPVRQLSEHQNGQLIVAGQLLDVPVAVPAILRRIIALMRDMG